MQHDDLNCFTLKSVNHPLTTRAYRPLDILATKKISPLCKIQGTMWHEWGSIIEEQ